ncbi:unnamed protein product [Staurois parvus]|uniref:Uncharacterized protein n=1 Tax=Staurois parvus TaxID=386267 RepID=A0ABN9DX25_9NEOB|nr:unnamed protein product [Staurois parvus]
MQAAIEKNLKKWNWVKSPKGAFITEKHMNLVLSGKLKNCYQCWCFLDGSMKCCSTYGTPIGYDEENCEAVFDKASCSYNLIPKYDPTVKCESKGMVG